MSSDQLEAFLVEVRRAARRDVGLREIPPGSNRSPRFDQAARAVGLDPDLPQRRGQKRGYPYCASMLHLWFLETSQAFGVVNPMPRTARVSSLLKLAPMHCRREAPRPGAIGIHLLDPMNPNSDGHAFLVDAVLIGPGFDRPVLTIEANTGAIGDLDPTADRDGDGVREKARPLAYANCGYLLFGA